MEIRFDSGWSSNGRTPFAETKVRFLLLTLINHGDIMAGEWRELPHVSNGDGAWSSAKELNEWLGPNKKITAFRRHTPSYSNWDRVEAFVDDDVSQFQGEGI